MIGQLNGIVVDKQAPVFVIDCQGVGYEVHAPMTTFYALPKLGEKARIYTHLSIRDDEHRLFGFSDQEQRLLFKELIKVNGVGPKLALAILSSLTPQEFVHYVHEQAVSALVKLPGIGKKTAERLLVEMKDRLKDWQVDPNISPSPEANQNEITKTVNDSVKEAVSALISLGYRPQEASKAVEKIKSSSSTSEELIKLALRNMI